MNLRPAAAPGTRRCALPQPAIACDARRRVCGKLTTPKRNLVTVVDLAVIGPWFAPPGPVGHRWGECEMSSISSSWRAGSGAHRFGWGPQKGSSSGMGVALRLLAAALTAAALAACAQQPPPVVTNV